jgi:hypothetical protein
MGEPSVNNSIQEPNQIIPEEAGFEEEETTKDAKSELPNVESSSSIVLAFEPLLDQFFRELESITELSLQATDHSQECSMVEDSRRRIADIERNAKEENEEVIACNNNIAQWEHQIKELQEKIVAERERKVEAKKALRHWENVEKIMREIQELTTAKDFAEKKLK